MPVSADQPDKATGGQAESYQDCGMVGSLRLWSCLRCGALAASRGQHDEWHESFEKDVRSVITSVFREAREAVEAADEAERRRGIDEGRAPGALA